MSAYCVPDTALEVFMHFLIYPSPNYIKTIIFSHLQKRKQAERETHLHDWAVEKLDI